MDENQDNQTPWSYTPGSTSNFSGDGLQQTQRGVPLAGIPEVSWTASEFVATEKEPRWYAALAGASIAIVFIIYVITQDIFASIVVALACIILGISAARKPQTRSYTVGEGGVQIGEKAYVYSDFRSFSVVEEGAINSIWLKPLKRYSPVVVMYFAPEDEQKIIDVLANFLPHETRQLDAIDRLSRRMRF